MQLQFFEVLALSLSNIPPAFCEQREIEVRQPDVRFRRDRLADQPFGACGIPPLQGDHAQRILRGRDVRVDLQRPPELLLRFGQVPAVQPDLTNLISHEGCLGIDREILLEARQRGVIVAQPAVRLCQVDDGEVVVRLQAESPFVVVDRAARLAVLQVLCAQHEPGVDDGGIFAHHLIEESDDALK